MFNLKNKSIIMKVVDDSELGPNPHPVEPVDYNKIIEDVTKSVVIIIGFYMVADTAKQLLLR